MSNRNLPTGAAAFIVLLFILKLPPTNRDDNIRDAPKTLKQKISCLDIPGIILIIGSVPFMVVGQLVAVVGNVLLARLTIDTSTALKDDIPVGNAIIVFLQQLGAAIAVAIGENVFSDSLRKKLADIHVPIPVEEVIAVGPTGIRFLTTDDSVVRLIQQAYCFAFDMTMYFALAALIAAIPFAVGTQWLNAKPAKIQEEH
ncbi:hypothetical protein Daus18300_006831 [Diaporthe australafricana]|uniref:Uncharacterized protein n=1 Tax=Diaporthe australafricana TaxID=127596 RepID=A0ABR3WSD1_9PEZI